MHQWFRGPGRARACTRPGCTCSRSENEDIRARYALGAEENIAALTSFCRISRASCRLLKFDVFADMRQMLLGQDTGVACVWNACDPYTTQAVQGVEGQGQRSNCGRTNKDGIDFAKAGQTGLRKVPGALRHASGARWLPRSAGSS